ncbi:right-handed parallel beta-helix repeat-containing protein [Herpetosiphon llansteffanensis]|uniref:right-handed parallel beta-helix repeat-containing protein n=1 Tax=Herpetosiphon llansteffanensis TaxID=2094568 RepID=UPI000D7C23B2|nr:right-handed parallel beta-helix repeat-containing protein [Herpetosiphon llansteffanensis]
MKSILIALVLGLLVSQVGAAAPQSAVVAGELRADATFNHIGVTWTISGDTDRDSSLKLEYRLVGSTVWRDAAPAMRANPSTIVEGAALNRNYHAASAMWLSTGTEYELRATLSDPDGGSTTRTITKRTRSLLDFGPTVRTRFVVPGNGGGTGTIQDPFQGIQTAVNAAAPGDSFILAEGSYQPFQILTSGTQTQPIRISGPSNRRAIIDGANTTRGVITLGESDQTLGFVIVENLTIQNGTWGIDAQHTHDILISRNLIRDVGFGIYNRRQTHQEYNQTVLDNTIIGRTPWPGTGIPSERGIDLRGTGNIVAFNSVMNFGDCISLQPWAAQSTYGQDVYNNDAAFCVDDGIEIDYNQANTRVWNNRVTNARMGISVQPIYGGPAYLFRNSFFNLAGTPFKLHNQPTGLFIAHNSSARIGNAFSDDGQQWRNTIIRNNLMLGTRYAFEFMTIADEGFRDVDYNGWGTNHASDSASAPDFKWNNVRYQRLSDLQAIGVETHGVTVSFSDVNNATLPASVDVASPVGEADLRLKSTSVAINKGAVIANINEPFVTDGLPDLGAFELSKPLPHYGPRIEYQIPSNIRVYVPIAHR